MSIVTKGGDVLLATIIAKEMFSIEINEEIHFKNSHAAAIDVRDQILLFESMVQRFKTQSELGKKERKKLGVEIDALHKTILKKLKNVSKLIGEDWSACSTKNYAMSVRNFEFITAQSAAILSGWQRLDIKDKDYNSDIISAKVGLKGLISKLDYEVVLTKYLRVRERQKRGNVYLRSHIQDIESGIQKKIKSWDVQVRELGDVNSEWDNYSGEDIRGKLPPFEISIRLSKSKKLLYEGRVLYQSSRDRFFGAIHWIEMSISSVFTPDDKMDADDLNELLSKMSVTLDIHRRDWEASIAKAQKLADELAKKKVA